MNNPKNHKLKQKTKTNNPKNQKKPKSKLKMNKQKRQDPQRLKDIRIPLEPLIPECQVCEKQKANFYCTECKVHYCQNCESQVHTSFWKRKHNGSIFQEPYIPQEKKKLKAEIVFESDETRVLRNKIRHQEEQEELDEKKKLEREQERRRTRINNCPIHQNNKLSRYCKNCQKLICNECVFDHTNHETIAFDQPMDFYKELINEQKKCTQNHFEKINEKFLQLNNSEKEIKSKKEKIFREISKFYLNQKKLLDLLERNEIKLANDFFEQISKSMNKEKQTINDLKYSTETLLKQFNKLESNIKQSNSFGFYKLFSQIELAKTQEKPKSEFPRLCNEHKNKPYEFFCIDHKQLLCSHCLILNHNNCQKSKNLKEGYVIIQNELEEVINEIISINEKKEEFVQKIQNEKFNSLKEKQINIELVKKNYQKLNELTQYQFKKMNEEISIQQNEKYLQLNKQSMKMQKEIDEFNESEMIIKEIEICKKYNDYQQILINFFKLKKLLPILNKNKKNQLICNSKFNKINIISNDLKQNLKNWKLNLPFDPNKTQIDLPNEIQLENKLQFSILLKDQFNEIVNAQEFNPKAEILKSNSNEMITEITKFKEGTNQELIGEYLFQKEGEYQINMLINDQKIPKSPFKLKVIDHFFLKEESEILQRENNPKFNQILEKWIKEAGCNSNLKRRFNSRTDGWKIQTFHQKCDNKGKFIVLIKLKNFSLFGGFAAIDWDSTTCGYKQSTGNKSFLFSLISLDPKFLEPLKLPIYQSKGYEIYCYPDYGPTFGGGHDLRLGSENKNMNERNWSNLGSTYKAPFGYEYRSNEAQNFLAGSYENWDIFQIEMFCEK
ncbi:pep-cterm sorting domain-containing protein [Anaeramoeba flamelloides]|uniref:Pep-cterm sorting domain-containing protein n=1 Tax=Anaeramoeba flamelloides TaxID=1746091 RepID=A0ABQ8XD93_9EUKA|nr:pep-cterm sorting domain-containing protein [Anaeramoeba flamelloides]